VPAGTPWPNLAPDGQQFERFHLHTPQACLDDLRARLAAVCWPDQPAGTGSPIGHLRELAEYWLSGFDWRAAEARINKFPQFSTDIDGTSIHFVHVRSPEPDAPPLVLTQDWPDSFVALLDVIGPLTDPRAHGGDPSVAVQLVIPTLPGCGLSGPAGGPDWQPSRVAGAWTELAGRLGYQQPVTVLVTGPSEPAADLGDGWSSLRSAPPSSLARCSLVAGSPVGQLARIVATLGPGVDRDLVLAAATVNWLADAADSPARPDGGPPAGARPGLAGIQQWAVHDRGRFAAIGDPELFVTEVRQFFAGQHVRAGRVAAGMPWATGRRSLDAAVGA
jgi:hypothetical protein